MLSIEQQSRYPTTLGASSITSPTDTSTSQLGLDTLNKFHQFSMSHMVKPQVHQELGILEQVMRGRDFD